MLGAQYHDEQTVIDSAKSLSKTSLTKQCAFGNAKSFQITIERPPSPILCKDGDRGAWLDMHNIATEEFGETLWSLRMIRRRNADIFMKPSKYKLVSIEHWRTSGSMAGLSN